MQRAVLQECGMQLIMRQMWDCFAPGHSEQPACLSECHLTRLHPLPWAPLPQGCQQAHPVIYSAMVTACPAFCSSAQPGLPAVLSPSGDTRFHLQHGNGEPSTQSNPHAGTQSLMTHMAACKAGATAA